MGEIQKGRDSGYIENAKNKGKVLGVIGGSVIGATMLAAAAGACTPDGKIGGVSSGEKGNVPMTETINAGKKEIVINSQPINWNLETPVGVPGYPNAIPEGGVVLSDSGKRFVISYNSRVFDTVTYLHYSDAEAPVLGEIGSFYELGDVSGKEVYLQPFVAPMGNESGKTITLDQSRYYVGMIMTTGNSGTIVEPPIGPDGEYYNGLNDNAVAINPDNPSQAGYGYWRPALFVGSDNEDGSTTLTLLGVHIGGQSSIFIKQENLPGYMQEIVNNNGVEVFQMTPDNIQP